PHPQLRRVAAQQPGGGERLLRRDVPGAAENDVGVLAVVAARPLPTRGAGGGVAPRLFVGQVLQLRLLVLDDQVYVVAAAQAVVGNGEQAVGVGREVDA